jgi:hypothetical protein
MAKQQKTNFTHKDSLPQQAFLFEGGGVKISPCRGEARRSPD